ncbi:hypothetical protein EWM64_g4163 [Hericium alpestre]|uniref:Uncharacterized protein n=1 Tax=Hericium alpestre TaxID=135208 RepID=A0A4Z0A0Z2_9AGAM|nr:hypothetical protein EWM64_g4163 [Hericium alpestre]
MPLIPTTPHARGALLRPFPYLSLVSHRDQKLLSEMCPKPIARFALDTSASFGGALNCGVYGHLQDAATDIIRHHGIGPLSKWVDDHIIIRILLEHLTAYNALRSEQRARILQRGGPHQSGGRLWYGGSTLPDGRTEEFDEDMVFPIRDLSSSSQRSANDARFSCNLDDINRISDILGIPWQLEKDIPFSTEFPFTGFLWNLSNKTVAIPDAKKSKYLAAITEWQGSPYITSRKFKNYASSGMGIAITIGNHWRAWRLLPNWHTDDRNIGWAEAVGFEFLTRTLIAARSCTDGLTPSHAVVYGDNKGIVEGWWNGRSCNPQINGVFKHVHAVLEAKHLLVHSRYVRSASNPADAPSHGHYPPTCLLIAPIPIPAELQLLVVDYDSPPHHTELKAAASTHSTRHRTKSRHDPSLEHHAERDFHSNRHALEFAITFHEWTNCLHFDVPLPPVNAVVGPPKPYSPGLTPFPSALRPHCPASQ